MARNFDSRTQAQKDSSKAQARIDREDYFAQQGATLTGWMGGPRTVSRDKTKYRRKAKYRGEVY